MKRWCGRQGCGQGIRQGRCRRKEQRGAQGSDEPWLRVQSSDLCLNGLSLNGVDYSVGTEQVMI